MAAGSNTGRIFSRTTGISPSDIVMTTSQPDGTLATQATGSPSHGSYPNATRVMLSADESIVAGRIGPSREGPTKRSLAPGGQWREHRPPLP